MRNLQFGGKTYYFGGGRNVPTGDGSSGMPTSMDWWNDEAVPQHIRDAFYDEENNSSVKFGLGWSSFINDFAASVPVVGGLLKAFSNLYSNANNSLITDIKNRREQIQAAYENWYNSPKQQVLRMRAAGLNPYNTSFIRSFPAAHPAIDAYQFPVFNPSSTFASDLNAMVNYANMPYRQANLESLTDINNYKVSMLLPQIYERNGYVNGLMELQVAWEEKNYDKERQIKQDMLNTSYRLSLADLGEQIMLLQPNFEGGRTVVNPDAGTIDYINTADGSSVDLTDMKFSELPIVIQQAFTNILSKRGLTDAQINYYNAQANTTSALGALYNVNQSQLQYNLDNYKRTGVLPTDDYVLRSLAGIGNMDTYWKSFGIDGLEQLMKGTINVGTSYLSPQTMLRMANKGGSPVVNPNPQPIELKIPRGARPYTANGQTYYNWK